MMFAMFMRRDGLPARIMSSSITRSRKTRPNAPCPSGSCHSHWSLLVGYSHFISSWVSAFSCSGLAPAGVSSGSSHANGSVWIGSFDLDERVSSLV